MLRSIKGCACLVLWSGLMLGLRPASAMVFAGDDYVNLPDGQTIDGDWYAAGHEVTLAGRVTHDAFIAGRQAVVTGEVGEDANIAADTAAVNAPIQGTARLAGRSITLTSHIAGEALLIGQSIYMSPGARIGRDTVAAASQITLEGTTAGRIRLHGDVVNLNGTFNGDVIVKARRLNIQPQAQFAGRLTYDSPNELVLSPGAQAPAQVRWNKTPAERQPRPWLGPLFSPWFLAVWVSCTIALLAVGIILIVLLPESLRHYGQTIREHPWPNAGWGALTLIAAPLAILILALTVIGIPLALILFWVFVLAILWAQIAAGYWVGTWIYRHASRPRPIPAFIVGFLAYSVLALIPFFGGLVRLAGTVLGLGGWWTLRRQRAIMHEG